MTARRDVVEKLLDTGSIPALLMRRDVIKKLLNTVSILVLLMAIFFGKKNVLSLSFVAAKLPTLRGGQAWRKTYK